MKKVIIIISLFVLSTNGHTQSVGIGTTTPHSSAMMEVQSNNKGILVPRISLSAANVASPVSSPADALLIYNTATAGSGANAVTPGFYHWSAAASRWESIGSTNVVNNNVGFGTWGDCTASANISEYNPVAADDGLAGDKLGTSVAVSGNFAIAGAPYDDNNSVDQGAAYVYYYDGSNWVQQQKLTAIDGAAGDNFGSSVSISGNYIVVGVPGDDTSPYVNVGSVYIFFYNGNTWVQQQKIIPSGSTGNDQAGNSVCIDGNRLIVGAYQADVIVANDNRGAAYIYQYNGLNWGFIQKLTASDGNLHDWFGYSVSIEGNKAVVGAFQDDGAQQDQGSAYIFSFNVTTWVEYQKLNSSNAAAFGHFGCSVSISGNWVIIGAPDEITPYGNADGATYCYYFNGALWVMQQRITADDQSNAAANFGVSVIISGNYAIIGADHFFVSGEDRGAAHIYQNIGGGWKPLQKITDPGGLAGDDFGFSCGLDDKRFLIGAPGCFSDKGLAYFGKIN